MTEFILTNEQQIAYDAITQHKTLFLEGAAGSGKSVIITQKLKEDPFDEIVLCAMTNKACKVLEEKLATGVKIPTVHSVLGMRPCDDGSTKIADEITEFYFVVSAINNVSLVGKSLIVDEASMMCRNMQNYIFELLQHGNLDTVTFVGDRLQLPCVKGDSFQYDRIDYHIKLQQVQRAKGDLVDYYNEIRPIVHSDKEFPLYKNAQVFTNIDEFVNSIDQYDGSKVIITHTNQRADQFSKLIDSNEAYVGQKLTALSPVQYKHIELIKTINVDTNSTFKIVKLFKNYDQMQRDVVYDDYEYCLPIEQSELEIKYISYAKALNDQNEAVYISLWNGSAKDKENLLLNCFNKEYRIIQDKAKSYVSTQEWDHFAKKDGYLKKLSKLNSYAQLPAFIKKEDALFWKYFNAIKQAIVHRSVLVSTAHRAQGITVDIVGIDIDNLNSIDNKLMYVALTRASKNLVFFKGETNE